MRGRITEEQIVAATKDVGHLINANNGQCPLIENTLLRLMGFVADAKVLLDENEQLLVALEEMASAFDEQPDQAAALSAAERLIEKARAT